MQRLTGLALLATLTIPATASHPPITRTEKPRLTESAEPPLAVPRPIWPSPAGPILDSRLLINVLFPNRWLSEEVLDWTGVSAQLRMYRLLRESEDLRQAREEWHRFWMNNQPSVLSYERLNGAIGP